MTGTIRCERYKVTGEKLVQTVKQLVHAGNVRRIVIKDQAERTMVDIPLTVGVVGALVAPVAAAIGAIAALAAHFTIEVELEEEDANAALAGEPR
jgi:hypothetical protein